MTLKARVDPADERCPADEIAAAGRRERALFVGWLAPFSWCKGQ